MSDVPRPECEICRALPATMSIAIGMVQAAESFPKEAERLESFGDLWRYPRCGT